jgi:hypothetical protein
MRIEQNRSKARAASDPRSMRSRSIHNDRNDSGNDLELHRRARRPWTRHRLLLQP